MPPWKECKLCRRKYYPWTTCGCRPPQYASMWDYQKFIPIKKEENT